MGFAGKGKDSVFVPIHADDKTFSSINPNRTLYKRFKLQIEKCQLSSSLSLSLLPGSVLCRISVSSTTLQCPSGSEVGNKLAVAGSESAKRKEELRGRLFRKWKKKGTKRKNAKHNISHPKAKSRN